jgi:hypothetical protein
MDGTRYRGMVMKSKKQATKSANPMQQLRRHISALANLPESKEPLISAYFDLREDTQRLTHAFESWSISAKHTLPAPQRKWYDQAKSEVLMVLRQDWCGETKGLAVFARAGEHPLLMALPFEAALETYFDVSPRPAIFPLVQLKDRFHRFVLVIRTEDTARILELSLGMVTRELLARKPTMASHLGRQLSREHDHHRREEDGRRFLREQVQIITNLMAQRGHNHLILAGHPRHIVPLREHLPTHLQCRVVGSLFHAPNGHDCTPLVDQAIDAFIRAEQEESRNTVERLHEQIRRRGLAVVGIHACRDAIELGAVSQLVISEELPHSDREMLVRMAIMHDLPIEVCEGDALLLDHGGVGCLLRFRMDYLARAISRTEQKQSA